MIGIGWTGPEIEMLIERPRLVVLGMDKQRPDAGDVGGLGGAPGGVLTLLLMDVKRRHQIHNDLQIIR